MRGAMKAKGYEASKADRKADKGMKEGGKADMKADAKEARKVPARDGLAKFARSIKAI